MDLKKWLVVAIIVLLLALDFLSFHDIFEMHSLRDWLTLLLSILVFFYFAKVYLEKK